MSKKYVIGWMLTLVVAGCASPMKYTSEGASVRTITPVVAQNCQHLGIVHSWKPALDGGVTAAQIDIRNQVGLMGGNAMVLVSQQIDPPPYRHADIMAEVYVCEFANQPAKKNVNRSSGDSPPYLLTPNLIK